MQEADFEFVRLTRPQRLMSELMSVNAIGLGSVVDLGSERCFRNHTS
jgi:hypothetical protein